MKLKLTGLLTLVGLTGAALAAPETFDFKDPKRVNNAAFKLTAPLETLVGNANGISGTVTFDPDKPAATKGKILVATSSLQVPNPMQKQHMLGGQWLDAAQFPEITFEAKELKNVTTTSNLTSADVLGTFTLKGVAKEMTVPVKLTYLEGKLADRVPGQNGDLLVIRANFNIQRRDFNILPGQREDKVSDTIELTLGVVGAAPR